MTPPFTLIRSRRRTVALIIQTDGKLLVRAPLRLAEARIRDFIESKLEWVKQKQAEMLAAQKAAPPPKQFVAGEKFTYLGEAYPLEIVPRARPALALENGRFRLAKSAQPRAQEAFERWYRAQAAQVLAERVQTYLPLFEAFGCKPSKIRISSARTRWGSCSSTGTLSFTWRLVLTPLPVIDYVVVHELAHLRVRNHSKDFWQLVKAILPDYAKRRAWLKANGGMTDHA
ncbi:MAG TPA: SprT family zinc-dependent metalloprotease [Anaerolineaceae bacterium]|nr:SprT family zinc-dependent metalloprotease [Anaerolineaceae bacterium]